MWTCPRIAGVFDASRLLYRFLKSDCCLALLVVVIVAL